jgi:hypothetical protein
MADSETAGLRLIGLGFVAVIAVAGLVLMLTQVGITGKVSGLQKLGTQGIIERTPYEACRAVHTGAEDGVVPVWSGFVDPRNELVECVSPTNPNKRYYAELRLKYG